MNNITGPPVTGDDFFGREDELEYAWKRIKAGNNLNLPAPRRVGKTSFALKLLEKAKKEGWQVISMNLEKISTEQAFIELLVENLKNLSWWEKTKDGGKNFLDFFKQFKTSVSYEGAKLEVEWQKSKSDIYKQLANLLNHSEPTLIFFDEVTVLLNSIIKTDTEGKRDVTNFLHWLRDIRIMAGSKIKWIFCSSVGIENFTHRHNISDALNELHDYKLKSYSKEESINMLQLLGTSNDLKLTNEVSKAIVDKLEYCLPFFLQLIFDKIHYLHAIEKFAHDEKIVEVAYNSLTGEKHFNTWIERIDEQYEGDARFAFAALKFICQAKEGVTRTQLTDSLIAKGLPADESDEVVPRLLYMLKNDGYLAEEEGRYYFRSPLLRDFWLNRYVK